MWSNTRLDTLIDCGLKYKLRYIDKIPEVPAWWNVGGNAFHATAREFEAARLIEERFMTPDQAAEFFRSAFNAEIEKILAEPGTPPSDEWRKANAQREGHEWWLDKGPEMAALYVKRALTHPDRPLVVDGSPMLEFELRSPAAAVTSSDRGSAVMPALRGFIDHVAINHGEKRVKIKDYKTGSRIPSDPLQLNTYALLLVSQMPGILPAGYDVWGEYWNGRKGTVVKERPLLGPNVDVATTVGTIGTTAMRYQVADATVKAGLFNARPSDFCSACSVRSHCPIMATREPAKAEPMAEFVP